MASMREASTSWACRDERCSKLTNGRAKNDGKWCDSNGKRHHGRDAGFCQLVQYALAREQQLADLHPPVRPLNGGQDQAVVYRHGTAKHTATTRTQAAVRPVSPRKRQRCDPPQALDREKRGSVGQADRRRGEYLPDPPLLQRDPQDRRDQCEHPRQQDHHRPADILGHQHRLAPAPRHLDRHGAAGHQGTEKQQIAPRHLCQPGWQ